MLLSCFPVDNDTADDVILSPFFDDLDDFDDFFFDVDSTDDLAFLMMIMANKKRRCHPMVHSRLQKIFHRRLALAARRRRQRRCPRVSLQSPSVSAWVTLFGSGNDQALITLTGFDHNTFHWLLERFAPVCDSHSPCSDDGHVHFCGRERRNVEGLVCWMLLHVLDWAWHGLGLVALRASCRSCLEQLAHPAACGFDTVVASSCMFCRVNQMQSCDFPPSWSLTHLFLPLLRNIQACREHGVLRTD